MEKWYEPGQDKSRKAEPYERSVQTTKALLENALRLRLRSDVPVGSTWSGGLDSSAIVCMLNRIKPEGEPLHTLSSCFEEKAFDEQEYMDAVIEKTGVVSHKIWPEIKLDVETLDKDIWQEDEPYTSMAGRAVYEKARELNLPVMLVGEGADEYLAGYTNFFEALFLELLFHGNLSALAGQMKAYKAIREPNDHVSLKHLISVTAADFLLPTPLRDWLRVHRGGYAAGRFLNGACLNHREVYRARNLYTSTSTEAVTKAYLLSEMPRILHALDRNSMAYSVETRAPFLDVELLETAFQMPLPYKLWDGVTKRVLRDAAGDDLPEKVRSRYGKMGFMSPEFQWFYAAPDLVTELLEQACDALPGYVDKAAVSAWCAEHRNASPTAGEAEWLLSRLLKIGRWMHVFSAEL